MLLIFNIEKEILWCPPISHNYSFEKFISLFIDLIGKINMTFKNTKDELY